MRFLLCLIAATTTFSCNTGGQKEPFKSLLKTCDEVDINFYNGGDSIHYQTKDSLGIRRLSETVTGNTETIGDACKPAGELYFRAHNDTLLRAEFAIMPSANKNDCSYITYNYQNKPYKERLTERAYKILLLMYPKPVSDTTKQQIDSSSIITDTAQHKIDTATKK